MRRLTPPLIPLSSSSLLSQAPKFSLSQCSSKGLENGALKASMKTQAESRRDSLTGLFALLQVVNKIDHKAKEDSGAASDPIVCGNKYCSATKSKGVTEEGWSRRKFGGTYIWLCKRCTGAYQLKQYCVFCKQIYTDKSDKNAIVDGLDWIQCNTCNRWTHIKCEASKGSKDIEAMILDPFFVYNCGDCSAINPYRKKTTKRKNGHWYSYG